MLRQMKGTQEWIDECGRVGNEGKMALLLGRNVKGLEREVGNRVDKCVMEEVRKWWQRRNWFTVEVPINLDPYITPKLSPPITINTHDMVVISVNHLVCI